MQNKPVIFFSTYDDIKNPHYGGGGAVAVHEVAKRLSGKFTVRVISWNYSGRKTEVIDSVRYERFGYPVFDPKISMFCYQLFLPFVMMQKKFAVWMESFCPPFTTAFLPLFTKKPVVGIVHMLSAEDMERKYGLPFHLIQNAGLKRYRRLIVTSDTLKKKIQKIDRLRSPVIISNGVTGVAKPVLKKSKYFLFLGRIEVDQKGIDLLIDAFSAFGKRFPGYKLIIAGSGDPVEIEKMKKLIREKNLTRDVLLQGKVTGKTKAGLFEKASAVIIPSRFETYSLVALEAMSYGAPVITFAIDGLSWIPVNASIKVPAFSVSKLSDAMVKLVSGKTVSKVIITAGNAYAKQFTWDKIAKEYEEYLERIMKQEL
jgi:glycosyltransferase involved in cell wall biosynthesis